MAKERKFKMHKNNEDQSTDKPIRSSKSAKGKKEKVTKENKTMQQKPKTRNPKAFAINAPKAAERRYRRKQDLDEKRHHMPKVDRTPIEPPPVVVAVVGPPGVGKTTLIKSLVKHLTKQGLSNIFGPVTVVASKKRRVTIIECKDDIHCMLDVAKISDVVLMLVDATVGLEMEFFEYISICKAFGLPPIVGILTHLDKITNRTHQKKVKKEVKKRFWTETYKGAKMFFVSSLMHGNMYGKRETQNIAKYVSSAKFRPLTWQTNHPYILIDRVEDLTNPEQIKRNPSYDRRVSMYGYVRGAPLKPNTDVHIPGCGDFRLKHITMLPNPCPLPQKSEKQKLSMNQRLIYAPFCGVGGVLCDKDAVYIDLAGAQSFSAKLPRNQDSDKLINEIRVTEQTIFDRMKDSKFEFVTPKAKESLKLDFNDKIDIASSSSDDGDDHKSSSSEDDEEEEFDPDTYGEELNPLMKLLKDRQKNPGAEKAEKRFLERQNDQRDLQSLVYQSRVEEQFIDCTKERNFKVPLKANGPIISKSLFVSRIANDDEFDPEGSFDDDCGDDGFVDYEKTEAKDIDNEEFVDDDFDHSKFDDIETFKSNPNSIHVKNKDITIENGHVSDDYENDEEQRRLLKLRKKVTFDQQYDTGALVQNEEKTFYEEQKEKIEEQASTNRVVLEGMDEEVRIQVEGFRAGLYVRLEFERIPAQLIAYFDPEYPLIVGGMNPGEVGEGYVRASIMKHRFYPKSLLKTRDPLIISMGWKRFQTIPLYHVLDENMTRNRALKYTPHSQHCYVTFWGPPAPQGTGFVAFQQTDLFTKNFRISASGSIRELSKDVEIVKKLKLVGYPMEIFTKTAKIKGMFGSGLEAAKFEGAPLRTVSGIRGQIKKASKTPEGAFRATFEDKILMSDIVFLRTWFQVEVPKICLVVKTLLMSKDERSKWLGARTLGRIRHEEGLKSETSNNPDSIYKPMERKQFQFRPFSIPPRLQKQLPYSDKPKYLPKQDDKVEHIAAIKSEEEKRRIENVSMMTVLRKERMLKQKERRLADLEKRDKMLKKAAKKQRT